MNNTGQALPISKSRFEVAYNILIKIFKKKTSLKIAKNSHEVGFLQLSFSEKAKCNDLVLKALKNLISIDVWIKKNKKSRLRVELICILRLIVAEIFTRSGRKSEVMRNFSVLAEKNKKTINSKDYIRYFIHKSYKDFSEKNFYPHCELEPIFRKKLLDQYSELEIKEMENIFSSNTSLDIVLKQSLNINDFFETKAFVELHPSCIRLSKNESIIKMKGFLEGQWWIQNFSATLPVALLTENLENKNVLDICCAPGGKTFQLLDRGAKVTSIDKSPSRINIMKENLNRLGFNVKLICEDVFKYKPEKKFDYIFQMDGDLSHDPNDLDKMLDKLKSGIDVIIGSRYINGINVINWPLNRILLSKAASFYVKLVTGLPIKDPTSGFVGFRSEVLESILLKKINFIGYAFQIELKYKSWKKGFSLEEYSIIFKNREKGTSKMNSSIIWEAVYGVIKLRLNKIN